MDVVDFIKFDSPYEFVKFSSNYMPQKGKLSVEDKTTYKPNGFVLFILELSISFELCPRDFRMLRIVEMKVHRFDYFILADMRIAAVLNVQDVSQAPKRECTKSAPGGGSHVQAVWPVKRLGCKYRLTDLHFPGCGIVHFSPEYFDLLHVAKALSF